LRSDYAKADAFDRSGLFLIGNGDAFVIADVAPESAAARAGLKAKDRIVTIGGEAANSQSLNVWRTKLRELPVGTRLEVDVTREGKKPSVEVVLADRIPAT
jgi:S1-C subfamily serine protease